MIHLILLGILLLNNSLLREDTKLFNLSDALKKEETVYLSEIAADVNYILLEYTNESALSYINGVIFFKNHILIFDVRSNLLLFNMDGKFIRRIGKLGRGPGEYSNILGIDADVQNEVIYVLDNGTNKLLSYGLDGKYIPTSVQCQEKLSFAYHNGLFYLHTPINFSSMGSESGGINSFQLSIINNKGINVKNLCEATPKTNTPARFIQKATFSKSGSKELIYHIEGENEVYSIEVDSLKPKYLFNFGNEVQTTRTKSSNLNDKPQDFIIHSVSVIDKYIFLNYRSQGKPGLLLYDGKKFRNVESGNGGTIIDDIDGTGKLFYQLFFQNEILIEPLTATRILNKKYENQHSERINNLKSGLNDYGNPVLRVVSLK